MQLIQSMMAASSEKDYTELIKLMIETQKLIDKSKKSQNQIKDMEEAAEMGLI